MSDELPDDVGALPRLIDRLIEDGWHERPSGAAADHLCRLLQKQAADGEQWAQLHLLRWQHEGSRRRWNTALRAHKQRFISHDGKVLAVSGAYATAIRNDDGLTTGGFQPHLFMVMTREQLAESLIADERQQERLGVTVFVKRCLLAMWEAHPDACNVEDLLRASGIDPEAGLIEGVI